MSIVKMKALELLAPREDRKALLRDLQRFGWVALDTAPEDEGFQPVASDVSGLRQTAREVQGALDTLRRYAPWKTSLLAPQPTVSEKEFSNQEAYAHDLETARAIQKSQQTIDTLAAKHAQLENQKLGLLPWKDHHLPLEVTGTRDSRLIYGTMPLGADPEAARTELETSADSAVLEVVSEDRDQRYMLLLVHRSQEKEALDVLRGMGFSLPVWKGLTGTAAENIRRIDDEIAHIQQEQEQAKQAIIALADQHQALELTQDRIQQELSREESAERLRSRGSVVLLRGWLPADKEDAFRSMMGRTDCAWTLREPSEDEYPDVPVQLKNGKLTRCMNTVTNMYGLPAYGSLDPNPLMAPFFILFYGFMMADMGYGLLMMIGALVVLKKKRPHGNMRDFAELIGLCGVSTFLWGAATGGFFGDFIPKLVSILSPGTEIALPALFTPLDDTVAILIGSLILGLIQVLTGMVISVVKKIKDGKFLDALWSEITWWVILGGLAMMILGVGNVAGVPVVLCLGGLMLVAGCFINNKGFGKVTSLIGTIYNGVTGYFSDILSYLRLMALMLAGSVIAQVFNTLGAVFGNVILFIVISMVGNMLNFVLNLLGCYVHDLRLQCLEFFNRFFVEGGKPYRPLTTETKHVEIIQD